MLLYDRTINFWFKTTDARTLGFIRICVGEGWSEAFVMSWSMLWEEGRGCFTSVSVLINTERPQCVCVCCGVGGGVEGLRTV